MNKLSLRKMDQHCRPQAFHPTDAFEVIGMPVGHYAYIEFRFGRHWEFRCKRSLNESIDWKGAYATPEDALAALQAEVASWEAGRPKIEAANGNEE